MCKLPEEVQTGIDALNEHYEDFEENNRGANGYLFMATNIVSKQKVAIKFYSADPGEHQHDEPQQLATIDSPNVLPILDARVVAGEWSYFITPKCDEGDLDDYIQTRPSVHAAIDTALGVCRGVSEIHAKRMLHRDLKPANIVVDQGRPRIADFGSVKAIPEGLEDIEASRHSVLYRPPESFETERYSAKGDVYQIGLVTYQLLGGWLPYDGEQYFSRSERREYASIQDPVDRAIFVDNVIRNRSETGKLVQLSSLPCWILNTAKRAIRAMVCVNPNRRPTTIGDTAALLTQIRARLANWKWNEDIAQIELGNRTIQLRPEANNNYAAFQQRDGQYRRIPRIPKCPLCELVKHIKT